MPVWTRRKKIPLSPSNGSGSFHGFDDWETGLDQATAKEYRGLVRQRSQAKMKLVRIQRTLINSQLGLAQLGVLSKNLAVHYEEYSQFHSKIVALVPDEALEGQEDEYGSLENLYYAVSNVVEELLLQAKAQPTTQIPPASQAAPQVIIQQQPSWEGTQRKGDLSKYSQVIEVLKASCQILENCEAAFQSASSTVKPKQTQLPPKVQTKKSHAVSSNASQACESCGGDHRNYLCTALNNLTAAQKNEKIRSAGICFNCLRKGHLAKDCPSSKTYHKCQRQHHTLLHDGASSQEKTPYVSLPAEAVANLPPVPAAPSQPSTSVQKIYAPVEPPVSTTCSSSFAKPTKTVLLTAVENQPHPCRVLLDSGSQVNLVPEAAVMPSPTCKRQLLSQGSTEEFRHIDDSVKSVDIKPISMASEPIRRHEESPEVVLPICKPFCPPETIEVNQKDFQNEREVNEPTPVAAGVMLHLVLTSTEIQPVSNSIPMSTGIHPVLQPFLMSTGTSTVVKPYVMSVGTLPMVKPFPMSTGTSPVGKPSTMPVGTHPMVRPYLLSVGTLPMVKPFPMSTGTRPVGKPSTMPVGTHPMVRPYLVSVGTLPMVKPFPMSVGTRPMVKPFPMSVGTHPMVRPFPMSVGTRPMLKPFLMSVGTRPMVRAFPMSVGIRPMVRAFPKSVGIRPMVRPFPMSFGIRPIVKPSLTSTGTNPVSNCIPMSAGNHQMMKPFSMSTGNRSVVKPYLLFAGIHPVVKPPLMIAGNRPEAKPPMNIAGNHPEAKPPLMYGGNCSDAKPPLMFAGHRPEAKPSLMSAGSRIVAKPFVKSIGIFPVIKPYTMPTGTCPEFMGNPKPTEICSVFMPYSMPSGIRSVFKSVPSSSGIRSISSPVPKPTASVPPFAPEHLQMGDPPENPRSVNRVPKMPALGSSDLVPLSKPEDPLPENFSKQPRASKIRLRWMYRPPPHPCQSKAADNHVFDPGGGRQNLFVTLLLTQLALRVFPTLGMMIRESVLWPDSTMVLVWNKKPLNQLQLFVQNWIAVVQDHTGGYRWGYVRSLRNPADIVSRDQLPEALKHNNLWWNGPAFLHRVPVEYEVDSPEPVPEDQLPELKGIIASPAVSIEPSPYFSRFSNYRTSQRFMGYVLRFVGNCRKPPTQRETSRHLTVGELRRSTEAIIDVVQLVHLADEIKRICANEPCKRLANLRPIYSDGLLRVGGRLDRSHLPYESRHPIILPDKDPVVHT